MAEDAEVAEVAAVAEVAVAADPPRLAVRTDEPGVHDCHLHSSWMLNVETSTMSIPTG